MAAKVAVNYKHHLLLNNNSTFSSIKHLLPKRLSALEGFSALVDHSQKETVIFTSDFCSYKFQKSTQSEGKHKLILVKINPETRLLDDHQEILGMSGCKHKTVYRLDNIPDLEL